MVQHIHRYGVNHGRLPVVIFEDEHHIEVLQMELDTLEMDQLNIFEGDDERWPLGQSNETTGSRLQQHRGTEGGAGESQLAERRVEFDLLLRHRFDFFAKTFERRFEFVSELPLGLFGRQVVPVVHVLVFTQIGGDFSDLRVELDVDMLLLPEHDGVFQVEMEEDDHFAVTGLEEGVFDVVVEDIDFIPTDLDDE